MKPKISKRKFKKLLEKETGCAIQHDGWTCGTCFFTLDNRLENHHWQAVLYFRGDYVRDDLNYLREDWYKDIDEIVYILETR